MARHRKYAPTPSIRVYLYTHELPCNAAVAELVTKKWHKTTVLEYVQALGATFEPDRRAWTFQWAFPKQFQGKSVQVDMLAQLDWKQQIRTDGAVLRAIIPGFPPAYTEGLSFGPAQVLDQVCADPAKFSIVAERNLWDELQASFPRSPNPGTQARYLGEFLFTLYDGGGDYGYTTPWLVELTRNLRKPFAQAYFEQGWWVMGLTNGTDVRLYRQFVKNPDAWYMGMFNGEWLTPRGKPPPKVEIPPGWWFAPITLFTGKRTKTMEKLDADYERVPSSGGEEYNAIFGTEAYGSQSEPWPGWHEQIKGRYLVTLQREMIMLVQHFLSRGWF